MSNFGLQKAAEECGSMQPVQLTAYDRLVQEKQRLTKRLADVDQAIELMDKMPDVQKLLNLLSNVY